MKQFLFFKVFFLLYYYAEVQAQTYANVPEPENILVVYKLPDPNNDADTISRAVKDYYQTARGIPEINIVELS